jgi:L-ascorbate metabolism protein UlaG (beta-lactamase superfamily)
MNRSRNTIILLGLVIGAVVVATPLIMMLPPATSEIEVTVLMGAGVIIETKGTRIYIDPLWLPSNYSELPADVILITHPHVDNYHTPSLDIVNTNDTLFVCPENMTEAIDRYDGVGVNPGDSIMYGDFNITAFPMYAPDYTNGVTSNHPREANWTSFIIDIDGFRILHTGDAKYMDEYDELTGTIDLAILSINFDITWGGLNESLLPIIDAINTIQPKYTIPVNSVDGVRETFVSEYYLLIESSDCEVLNLGYWTSCIIEIEGN